MWLSQVAHIDKVAALRMVVLEWQKRPAAQMLSRSVDEEDSETPDGLLDISIFASKSSTTDAPKNSGDPPSKSFDSTYSRQLRLIRLAISEASYVLAVSELRLRQYAMSQRAAKEQAAEARGNATSKGKGKSKEQTPDTPSDDLGRVLFEAACPGEDGSKTISDSVIAMRKITDLLGLNGVHPVNKEEILEKYWDDLETFWFRSHFMRLVGYLQYVFTIADSSSRVPTAQAVLTYFEYMHQEDFFVRLGDWVRTTLFWITLIATNFGSQFQAWQTLGGSSRMSSSSHLSQSSD
jgi:nuclear pore complex protein Nup188